MLHVRVGSMMAREQALSPDRMCLFQHQPSKSVWRLVLRWREIEDTYDCMGLGRVGWSAFICQPGNVEAGRCIRC